MGPKTLMVTGASGFIGAHLITRLTSKGYRIAALVRETSNTTGIEHLGGVEICRVGESWAEISDEVARVQPELIIHLASLFLSDHRAEDIEPLIRSNLLFGSWLLEAAVKTGVKGFINTGTSWEHFLGEHRATNLYAATKRAFEELLRFYCDSGEISAITLKLFDTYGPRDPRRKLIPLLIEAMRNSRVLDLSPGDQYLDLLHVDDVCDAFEVAVGLLATMAPEHISYSLRTKNRVTLRELVALLSEIAGRACPVEFGRRPYRRREIMVPWEGGDSLPEWAPKVRLRDGLREVLIAGGVFECDCDL